MKHITICIATYKRPIGLRRLLTSLGTLKFPRHKNTDVRIVVVDNDAGASARDTVERIRESIPWPMLYDVEPQRGISFARNRTVALAGDVDFVAFIDDDEEADPLWLDELLDVQHKYHADIVFGPVVPEFDSPIPAWLAQAQACRYHPRLETGRKPRWLATCNVLVDHALLRQLDGPFDARFAMTGGEDGHLFKRLTLLGARSVWANDALVTEYVPASRTTLGRILRRAYSVGIVLALIERHAAASKIWPLKVGMIGLADLGLGMLLFLPSLFLGRYRIMRSLRYVSMGWGMCAGLTGFQYEEYRQVHGK